MRSALSFILLSASLAGAAQVPGGLLRGRITQANGNGNLTGAGVVASMGDTIVTAVSNDSGLFSMHLPVGLYTVKCQHVGHETRVLHDVWIRSGKESVLDIELVPAAYMLETFTITAMAREEPEGLGVREFTVEQGLRYPAMFQDPARSVTGTPGVAAPNDQANHLVIRGKSPLTNAWMLEGVEIVNPNHLSNAGTPTDLPTLTGGGVNILSAQMLGPSRLRTGVSPIAYGNALGGLMDMELRRGNEREQEWTLQAGLTGLDVSTEGPVGRGGRAFHLVNYRYSTVGLLGAIGVDLGDEAIRFHDLSVHAGTSWSNGGELRFFALGGTSRNEFTSRTDTAEWTYDKDSQDITYKAGTGVLGTTLALPLGAQARLSSTLAWSRSYQSREAIEQDTSEPGVRRMFHALDENKLSFMTRVDGRWTDRLRYTLGGGAMERRLNNLFNERLHGWLLRPFAQLRVQASRHLQVTAGVAYSHLTQNGSDLVEPRVGLRWRMSGGRSVAVAYGIRGQMPYHPIIMVGGINPDPHPDEATTNNTSIGLMRAQDITVGYEHPLNEHFVLRVEGYDQAIIGMPVSITFPFEHAFNAWDAPLPGQLEASGEAHVQGLELTLLRSFVNGIYYQINGSGSRSLYRDIQGAWQEARWNLHWTANGMMGREFRKVKADKVRTWGVSARLFGMGGLRYMQVAVPVAPGDDLDGLYPQQFDPVYRLDLRVYLKTDRNGRTGQWAIDLQNATNARNAAFVYFDQRQNEPVTRYQLGLIPNLSYRIEF